MAVGRQTGQHPDDEKLDDSVEQEGRGTYHFTARVLGRLLNEQTSSGRPADEDRQSLTSAVALVLAGHGVERGAPAHRG